MICKSCGAQTDDKARFCPSCGHSMTSSQSTPGTTGSVPRWFKWLLGVLAVACIGGAILVMGADELTSPIEEQLKAIQTNNYTEAYYNYTTKDFQDSTSLDKFKEFLKVFPALSENQSVRFIDRKADENLGTLDAILTTKSGDEIKAQYRLVMDPATNKWKIQSIKFEDINGNITKPLKNDRNETTKAMAFSQFALGTAVDEEGIVRESIKAFPQSTKDIFLNLYVSNGTQGTKIDIDLSHLESNSKIPAVSTELKEDGHAILTIVFSPPKEGWPKGSYLVNAISSTGIKNSYDFKIE